MADCLQYHFHKEAGPRACNLIICVIRIGGTPANNPES